MASPGKSKHQEIGSLQPPYNAFTQQELPGRRPILTPAWMMVASLLVGCVFIPVGAVCLQAALSVKEISLRYDDTCASGATDAAREASLLQAGGTGTSCSVSVTVPSAMRGPILVYYSLDSFQQNHRRYVRSRSDAQIRGAAGVTTTSLCQPQEYLAGNQSQLIRPCGLIAWSLFNDTFQDRAHKFAALPSEFLNTIPALAGGGQVPGTMRDDEHLIVWMRPASLPNFRKLWGRLRRDLEAGTNLTLTISNRYNSYRYGGRKHVILTTANWLGGRNVFLGAAYLAVGGASLLLCLTTAAAQLLFGRHLGDLSRLSWLQPAG